MSKRSAPSQESQKDCVSEAETKEKSEEDGPSSLKRPKLVNENRNKISEKKRLSFSRQKQYLSSKIHKQSCLS